MFEVYRFSKPLSLVTSNVPIELFFQEYHCRKTFCSSNYPGSLCCVEDSFGMLDNMISALTTECVHELEQQTFTK